MITKNWKAKPAITAKAEKSLAVYPEFLRKLLFGRGIVKSEEAEVYLNPSYERDLYDPYLMKDMKKAVARIVKAIKAEEKIVVFADYDADGVPGAVILHTFFKEIGYQNFEIYIPDRNSEAYGLNTEAVERFAGDGVKLVITIDCGITSVDEVKRAGELGLDVIVTDHHEPQAKLPKASAVVDCKQKDETYPFSQLSGASVAFKLVLALMPKVKHDFKIGWDKWLLDLVAISTVSDMVPLVGENRTLAHFGLKVLRQSKRLGIDALCRTMKTAKGTLTEDDISFMLAPRLNAASRMSHANHTFNLLVTENETEARDLAKHLEEKNVERKAAVDAIVAETEKFLAERKEETAVIVYGNPDWGLGSLGLASSRLKDRYGKCVFLWSKNGTLGEIKGSCRSDGRVNLVEMMALVPKGFFADFGGHFMAGGFSCAKGCEKDLEVKLEEAYAKMKKREIEEDVLVDEEIALDGVTWENYSFVEKMGPYGQENPKPNFLIKGAEIFQARTFGNGGIHLELCFKKTNGQKVNAIGFFSCSFSNPDEKFDAVNGHVFNGAKLEAGEKVDLLVNLEKSNFRNYPELRLRIVDIKPCG